MNFWISSLKKMCVFIFLSFTLFGFMGENYSLEEALKVVKAIDKIKSESLREAKGEQRKIVITESELNSYIAYRLETERDEITREIRLKLFEENQIEGKILIDLRNQEIPKFLKPEMNFYFRAKLEVEKSRVRLDIKKLFLENQPVPPIFLDLVIYISSKLEKTEASSINDWYELPYGIGQIKTHSGWAAIYY